MVGFCWVAGATLVFFLGWWFLIWVFFRVVCLIAVLSCFLFTLYWYLFMRVGLDAGLFDVVCFSLFD